MKSFSKRSKLKLAKLQSLVVLSLLIMGFQNCSPVAITDTKGFVSKMDGDTDIADGTEIPVDEDVPKIPTGSMPDGGVIVPVDKSPTSIYVCPPGTETPSAEPASVQEPATRTSYSSAFGVSYGRNASSSASASSSSDGGNYASIVQSGDHNYASIRQSGCNNHASIEQHGGDNHACVLQIGEHNESEIDQEGEHNSASVTQIGGQSSRITQNGMIGASQESAEQCGCRLVHCDSSNSSLDPNCRQAVAQKVISK